MRVEKKKREKRLGLSEVLVRVQLQREELGLRQEQLDLQRAKLELERLRRNKRMEKTIQKSLSQRNPFTI